MRSKERPKGVPDGDFHHFNKVFEHDANGVHTVEMAHSMRMMMNEWTEYSHKPTLILDACMKLARIGCVKRPNIDKEF